jgi:EAL domain-containing protein (putative c-di-GMP-specific phosphodiesterase class I)
LGPDQFLPFLEQTGSVIELTQWVVKEVLRLLSSAGTVVSEVAVNLSVRVLDDGAFPIWVARQLNDRGVAPAALRFEVTESTIMTDSAQSLVVLRELAALGVGVSLDDFGVGHSSLTYLAHLPVDELKIDKGFIDRMPNSAGDRTIVRTTINLGHDLGMRVVAEGVESTEQSDMLASLGCDILQGHLVGVAVTEEFLAAS